MCKYTLYSLLYAQAKKTAFPSQSAKSRRKLVHFAQKHPYNLVQIALKRKMYKYSQKSLDNE